MKKFKNIVLHMGPDKTGSTAIQTFFKHNDQSIEKNGILYFYGQNSTGKGGKGGIKNLPVAFCETLERAKKFFNADEQRWATNSKEYLKLLERKAETTTADTLLLSQEGLNKLKETELESLCLFLQTLGENIHVVLYARAPDSYAISAMSQRVKSGRRAFPITRPPVRRYRNYLEKAIRVFGRENVEVRLFDREKFPSGDVVSDFLSIPTLQQLNDKKLLRNFEGNPGFSDLGLQVGDRVIAILGKHAPKTKQFKLLFSQDLYQLKGNKVQLSKLQLKIIQLLSARHTKYLHKEFNIVFPETTLRYHKSDLTTSHLDREKLAQELIAYRLPSHQSFKKTSRLRRLSCFIADKLSVI